MMNSARSVLRLIPKSSISRAFCDSNGGGGSITYSGGHASTGQGGFYGSGGSRAAGASNAPTHHPEAIANQSDLTELARIVADVEVLENELRSLGTSVTSRSIEIKARIKKMISNPRVKDILNRLEIKGQPVWGLSSKGLQLLKF